MAARSRAALPRLRTGQGAALSPRTPERRRGMNTVLGNNRLVTEWRRTQYRQIMCAG